MADNSRQMRRAFDEKVRDLGVTGPQARLLLTMQREGGRNQGHYADLLDVEPITLCRMVDRLEEAGLVSRSRDPADRRAWHLNLTAEASRIVELLRAKIDAMIEDMLHGLRPSERDEFLRVLLIIRDNLTARNAHQEMVHG